VIESGLLPPAVNDERCKHCSLNDICQPEMMGDADVRGKND
jgi:CRISPR-associated exonuclease Cas4